MYIYIFIFVYIYVSLQFKICFNGFGPNSVKYFLHSLTVSLRVFKILFISERISNLFVVLSLFLFKILFNTFHVPLILVFTFSNSME